LTEPRAFYEALTSMLGSQGSLLLLKLLFKQIFDGYNLREWSPEEFVKTIIRGGEEARGLISRLIQRLPPPENM